MVVVNKLTMVSLVVLVKLTCKATNIAEIYMKEIFKVNGVPKAIVLDQDSKFTSNFSKGLFKGFGT
jgi:hypothetical protein